MCSFKQLNSLLLSFINQNVKLLSQKIWSTLQTFDIKIRRKSIQTASWKMLSYKRKKWFYRFDLLYAEVFRKWKGWMFVKAQNWAEHFSSRQFFNPKRTFNTMILYFYTKYQHVSIKKFKARETTFLTRLTQANLFQIHIFTSSFSDNEKAYKKHSLKEKKPLLASPNLCFYLFFHRNKGKNVNSLFISLYFFSPRSSWQLRWCAEKASAWSQISRGEYKLIFPFWTHYAFVCSNPTS